MDRLSASMQQVILNYNAGSVATVNADGSPAVSPKATFVVIDERRIAYGNIRSPGTNRNLFERPAVEVNFIDVLARVAVRIKGTGEVVSKDSAAGQELISFFEASWSAYLDVMQDFVCISIDSAELIASPAYDLGLTRDELIKTNFEKLSKLIE